MKPYKIKHKPTGLYWQPISHRGSHFSKRGKIYQTKVNILNMAYFSDGSPRKEVVVEAHKDTLVFKEFKDKLVWQEPNRWSDKYRTITLASDWEIEEI